MHDRQSDFALLREFVAHGNQAAFGRLVERHLSLVYAAALRKVEDPSAAQEITQNVFTTLGRKAWQFASDDSLPAWLHKSALLESKFWLRGELRRRRRERKAAELWTTMTTPEYQPASANLLPLLDEALLSLREKDRTALLLRYCESQSWQQVGAAFGISEDAARKRVNCALENLVQFFARRGFKTATLAATVAVLEHSAVTTSAALINTVLITTINSSLPASVGIGPWLARVAGLTRIQTAAASIGLVLVSMGWQLNQHHKIDGELNRVQALYISAQNEAAEVQAENQELSRMVGRLGQTLAQANEAVSRQAEATLAFEVWKRKTRTQLMAADYHWSDDSPFVRIPKSILPELSEQSDADPFAAPGVINPYARELMGLTSAEIQTLERTLRRHFASLEEARASLLFETNQPLAGSPLASATFLIPPFPEEEVKRFSDELLVRLRSALGEERWPLIQARLAHKPLPSILNLDPQESQQLQIEITANDKGTLEWHWKGGNGAVVGFDNGDLSMFLPGDDANSANKAHGFGKGFLSDAIRNRTLAWLQQQAIARVGKGDRP